ncbi:MAG TPA: prolyl oligopeptidase family serine peptidase, partial [Symbiobacteriaceae bacterium]|nr:prolyl oligopeptidase family serine peptidase [Symbiobacteriaceae bacterium]
GWVGVLGFSLGGVAAILAAAEDPGGVDAVVADSVFPDLHGYLTGEIARRVPLPGPKEAYFLWWFRRLTGIDEREVRPGEAALRLAPRPLLLIHGTDDRVIPVAQGRAFQASLGAAAELWVVDGARHTHSYERDPSAYCERIVRFFLDHATNPLRGGGCFIVFILLRALEVEKCRVRG